MTFAYQGERGDAGAKSASTTTAVDVTANIDVGDLAGEGGSFDIRKVNWANGAIDTNQTTTGGDSRTITQPSGWTSGWSALVTPQ